MSTRSAYWRTLLLNLTLGGSKDASTSMGRCNKPSANWPAIRIEGNRRDCSMSGNQTSGKGGGVQYVMMFVCMYT